jgi:hypothetical protein
MCLVYQPSNHKILSVSRKKIVCHEGAYANFDPAYTTIPKSTITEIVPAPDDDDFAEEASNPDPDLKGVHSVKVLRESRLNSSMNEPLPPPLHKKPDLSSSPENQGEDLYIPEMYLDENSLLKKINQNKSQTKAVSSTHQKISEALKNVVNKKQEHSRLPEEKSFGADVSARNVLKERRNLKELKRKAEIHIDDEVQIKTIRFGKAYAKGLLEFTHGKVVSMNRNI